MKGVHQLGLFVFLPWSSLIGSIRKARLGGAGGGVHGVGTAWPLRGATPRGQPRTHLPSVLSDLYAAPNSCQGRCLEAFDKHHLCHCNARCPEFGNCCEDFESLCGHGQSPAPFSIAPEAEELSRAIVLPVWSLDQHHEHHLGIC